jgi:hypothetical protein
MNEKSSVEFHLLLHLNICVNLRDKNGTEMSRYIVIIYNLKFS